MIVRSRIASRSQSVSGSETGGKVFPFPAGERVPIYCYGDSTMANGGLGYGSASGTYDYKFQDENNRGLPAYFEFYSNGRVFFDVRNNYGYGGDTTADTLAFITGGTPGNVRDIPRKTVVPEGTGGLWYLQIGTNNLGSANISYADSIDDFEAIIARLKVLHGPAGLISVIPPRTPLASDKRERQKQINTWLRSRCASEPHIMLVDGCSAISDENGDPLPQTLLDGLHPAGRGAALRSPQAWYYEGVGSFIGKLPFPAADNDNNIANPNLRLGAGTSSSIPHRFRGVVPESWQVVASVWDFPSTILTNPFTTNGTTTVTVNHPSHGLTMGDPIPRVLYRDAVAVGGVVIDGMYTIASIIDGNSYTITLPTAAAAETNGGGSVTYFNPAAYRNTIPVTNPFTSNGTNIVTVSQSNHRLAFDSVTNTFPRIRVAAAGAIVVGGVTLNQSSSYAVTNIVDANTYTINIGSNATAQSNVGGTLTIQPFNSAIDAVWEGSYDSDGVYTITGTIASASRDGYENLDFSQNLSSVTGNGDTIQLQAEARTTNAVNARGTAARLSSSTGSTSENSAEALGVYGASYWHTTDVSGTTLDYGLYETGYYTTSSSSDSTIARFTVAMQCYKGQPANVTVKIKRMQMVRTVAPVPATVEMQRVNVRIAPSTTAPAAAATLTSTDVSKCMVLSYGTTTVNNDGVITIDQTYNYRDYHTTVALTSTSLTNQRNSATAGTQNIAYFYDVVRADTIIDATYLQTAQLTTTQGVGADFEVTLTTAVDPARSFINVQPEVCNRAGSANAHISDIAAWVKPGDGTKAVVRLSSLAGTGTRNIILHVIQLKTGVVRNIVPFSINIATGATSNTFSLASQNSGAGVVDSNTMIVDGGLLQGGASSNTFNIAMASLARSGNTITAARGASSATLSLTKYGVAIEFNSGYINVQNQVATFSGTNTTAPVTSASTYNAARSFMMFSGASSGSINGSNEGDVRFVAEFGDGGGADLNTKQMLRRAGNAAAQAYSLTVPYQLVSVL